MIVEAQVTISGSKEAIWAVITNIEDSSDVIRSIDKVEVLENPKAGLIGKKWRETRTLFGKTATEIMWITAASDNESYETRAESHGFVYTSRISISGHDGSYSLRRDHRSKPQGLVARILAIPMGIAFKGMLKKALLQDLEDIKVAVEQPGDQPPA